MNFTIIRENKVGNLRVRIFAKVSPAIAKLDRASLTVSASPLPSPVPSPLFPTNHTSLKQLTMISI